VKKIVILCSGGTLAPPPLPPSSYAPDWETQLQRAVKKTLLSVYAL